MSTQVDEHEYRRFVASVEPRLRQALTALYGRERGREATMESLNWAFEEGGSIVEHADDPVTIRRLFAEAQGRSASLHAAPAFDRPAASETGVDPRVAGLLSVMPMQDRLTVLLTRGAGWSTGDVAELLGVRERKLASRAQRWLPRLENAVAGDDVQDDDHDQERALAAVLAPLFLAGPAPVTVEEAMNPELARAAASALPELTVRNSRLRAMKAAGVAVAVLVVLVGGIVIGLAATRSTVDRGYITAGPQPAPGELSDAVIVIPNPPQTVGARPGLRAVYELDAGTLRVLRSPKAPGVAATSIPVTSGPWLVDVQYKSAQSAGAGDAVAFRSGSSATRSLGLASVVYPGLKQGTFWLALHQVASDGSSANTCQVRLVTAEGQQVVRPTMIPCVWQILGAVKGGLLILTRTDATEIWNPANGLTDPLPGFPAAVVRAAGPTLVAQQWSRFCSVACRITLANPISGALTTVKVVPPKGLSLTAQLSLSPGGQYIAVTAMSINEATTMNNQPIVGPTTVSREIRGELVVVRVTSGEVAMSRPVTFLQPSLVEWAPDGSYVFLTRSATDVDAVPVWSLSVPVQTIHVPGRVTVPPDPGERFLVAGH